MSATKPPTYNAKKANLGKAWESILDEEHYRYLKDRRAIVLRVMPADGALLTGEIARRMEYPPTSALRGLRALEAAGLVVCVDRSTCPSGAALWRLA